MYALEATVSMTAAQKDHFRITKTKRATSTNLLRKSKS